VVSDPHKYNMEKPAEDGAFVYGLFIEGCRWNSESEVLAESFPKVLFSQMPHIWLKPAKMADIDFKHSY
jgi:dynein heavy chain